MSSATTTPAARPANRRELTLAAASRLFARRGYDSVSVADIAESVGVTAPALYRHFDNKEAILVSIVLGAVDRLDTVIADQQRTDSPLDGCMRALTSAVLDHPDQVVTYLRERHRLDGEHAASQTIRERRYLATFADLLSATCPGISAEESGVRVIGAVGVLRGYAERPPAMPRPSADAFIAEAILGMLTSASVQPGPTESPPAGTWEPRPSRREQILHAALDLFRERSFAGVGIGEIGEAAGVGASNVHRYFDSKDDILVDLYDRVGSQVHVRIDDAIARASDPVDALERMIDAYCRVAFDASDLVIVVTQNRGALPSAERPRLRRRDRRIMDLWRSVVGAVRPDLRASEVATLVAGILPFVNMYPQQQLVDLPDPALVSRLVRSFVLGGER